MEKQIKERDKERKKERKREGQTDRWSVEITWQDIVLSYHFVEYISGDVGDIEFYMYTLMNSVKIFYSENLSIQTDRQTDI